ncbi:MAG: cyclophilin family peptidyl-prolyl cis-trans isomerase [Flavobacteriales bacterium]|jgi:cyclophilin family peptidyl-prolyl cis-trans isomerase
MKVIRNLSLMVAPMLMLFGGCANAQNQEDTSIVVIHTDFGDMKAMLYNETPQHRENFLRLASDKFYKNLLFHRVINQFMIQGGDPESKTAEPNQILGNGGPGYNIPAEIVPSRHHKKGALSAARKGDQVNPDKASSGSQFYIVQGKVFNPEELEQFEKRMLDQGKKAFTDEWFNLDNNIPYRDSLMAYYKRGNQMKVAQLMDNLNPKIDQDFEESGKKYVLTEKAKKDYTTIGGTPHLDGGYTVFGEIIEGFDILDSIAAVEVDASSRPKVDVKMNVEVLSKKRRRKK